MSYQAKPGSMAYRAIAWLEQQPVGADFTVSQLAERAGLDVTLLGQCLAPAVDAGAVLKAPPRGQKRPMFYSLNPLQHPEYREPDTPQGNQPRSERGREGMEPAACESAAGRGTNGAPALATLPHTASPGVGPMGAEQPADAGLTTGEAKELAASLGIELRPVEEWGDKLGVTYPSRTSQPPNSSSQLRCALWSDGTLEILRTAEQREPITLTRDEVRALVAYLDAISLDSIA